MKRFIFLLLIFAGCSAFKYEKQVFVFVYDFTKYTESGFLFTTEKYLFEYESVGYIQVEFYPETEKEEFNKMNQYGTENFGKPGKWFYYPISTEEVLDSLYNISTRMGANAVINLRIEETEVNLPPVTAYGRRASGFAIKRLKVTN
jgi:hypothetical protein